MAAHTAVIDETIALIQTKHPRRFIVGASPTVPGKAARVIEIQRGELPECCRRHIVQL